MSSRGRGVCEGGRSVGVGVGARVIFAVGALCAATVWPASDALLEEPVSPTVVALAKAVREGDRGAVTRFWAQLGRAGTPLMEPVPGEEPGRPSAGVAKKILVTFVARDDSDSNVAVGIPMDDTMPRLTRVPGTDVWSRTFLLSSAARGPYTLVWPKGRAKNNEAIETYARGTAPVYEKFLDPLAARISPWVMESPEPPVKIAWFEGPAASKQPYLEPRKGVQAGRLDSRTIVSKILGNERLVSIYSPAGYEATTARPHDVALFFDREDFLSSMQVVTLLDNMISDKVIPPLVVVFVSPIDNDVRSRELPGYEPFQDFVLRELMPQIRQAYGLTRNPDRTVIGGASYGGLSAMLIALRAPEVFSNVVSLSGAFWWGPKLVNYDYGLPMPDEAMALPALAATALKVPARVFINVGRWEGAVMQQPNRQLRDVLIAKGSAVTYDEFEGGHDWISWRAALPDALIAVLATGSAP